MDARELAADLTLATSSGARASPPRALLEEAGASASSATSSSSASDDPDAAFAEWSQAFAAEVQPVLRAHGLEADALPGRAADILARAGVYPEWVAWYQSQLPPEYPRVDLDAAVEQFDDRAASVSNSSTQSPRAASTGSTACQTPHLRGEQKGADDATARAADSVRDLQVLRVDDDPENPDDATSRGRDDPPARTPRTRCSSEYRPGSNAATGGVFDLFAMLPPLVRNQPPAYPIGVLGLGAGTCAREFAQCTQADRRRVVGWEIAGARAPGAVTLRDGRRPSGRLAAFASATGSRRSGPAAT